MSKKLLAWYDQVMRPLPWRENKDPYRVWISEVMLQQTQVVTVISYFNRFIARFPDVKSLSEADESEVFKLWEGLGYYSRAKNLMRCAKVVVEEYGSIFPSHSRELVKLPGIGPYTAGAIASIAYDEKTPAIDGNVLRVVSRLNCIDLPINNPKNLDVFHQYIMSMMTERPGDFNQALMELGATICTPKLIKCNECPLAIQCCAFKEGTMYLYPNKPKKPPKKEIAPIFIIVLCKTEILIMKHPNEGLLNNLWGFPRIDIERIDIHSQDLEMVASDWLSENLGIKATVKAKLEGKIHVFTHLRWMPVLFFYEIDEKLSVDYPIIEWSTIEKLQEKALPTAFIKQLGAVKEGICLLGQKKS